MIRGAWRGRGVWVLLLALTHYGLALDPHRSLDHFGHQAWRTDSGLPQNTVHSILQTRDGYLWLGTDGGLVRFDGIDFVTFDTENTPQFKSDTVNDLFDRRPVPCGSRPRPAWSAITRVLSWPTPRPRACPPTRCGSAMRTSVTGCGPSPRPGRRGSTGKASSPLAGAQTAGPLHRHALAEDAHGTLWLGGSSGVLALDTTLCHPACGLCTCSAASRWKRSSSTARGGVDRHRRGLARYAGGSLAPSLISRARPR